MAAEEVKVIGGKENFWLYSPADGYDLTHPPTPESPRVQPRISLSTRGARVAIDPRKTALVLVDLQNLFLSPAAGKAPDSAGIAAAAALAERAIPACRRAGIALAWLSWGLTEADLAAMPPAVLRSFAAHDDDARGGGRPRGLGADLGRVRLADGRAVPGGRVLMRGSWNAALWPPLAALRRPAEDLALEKNRLSGLWGGGCSAAAERELRARGIRTLIFAGVNTDQCVAGTLQDAFAKGWDCLLLSDGCATTSPEYAKQCIEYNCQRGWGFVLSCEDLANGVDAMETGPDDAKV